MPRGSYLCPVCHHPFSSIGAKHDHVYRSHPEAAQLYLTLDRSWDALLRVHDVQTPIEDYSRPFAA